MKIINNLLLLALVLTSASVFAKGGDDAGNGGSGLLKRSPVQQYTCITKAGKNSSGGGVEVTSFAREFFYYLNEIMPDPIENNPFYICHDEQMYGPEDSIEFPRLELVSNVFQLYSRFDSRFQANSSGKMEIDRMIEKRVMDELGITTQFSIFSRYSLSSNSFGYVVRPFLDVPSSRFYCPSVKNFFVSPIMSIVTDYTGETEGLYLGEMEAQRLFIPNVGEKRVVAKIQVSETNLLNYGFYMRDGVKTRVEYEDQIETETIYFYFPFSKVQDPLTKGNRKLVTVRFAEGSSYSKKLGCVFKKQ